VPELTAELHRVKREPSTSSSGRWLERAAPAVTRIPGTVQAMYAVMARSVMARQRIGTVAVTAVGMFAGGGGFGVTSLTLMSLEVIVGGMTQRPRIVDGQAAIRDRIAARAVASHPEQGWSLLCNGVVLFDDAGALLPDGRAVSPAPARITVTAAA
jgi:Family of unknown function (DUF5999)